MKKLFIAASLIIGMIASAMVLSSFSEPKENETVGCSIVIADNGWREVGVYEGCYDRGDGKEKCDYFIIWEKEGMCGAYYWTIVSNPHEDPDYYRNTGYSGGLRQNSDKQWVVAYEGRLYILKGF